MDIHGTMDLISIHALRGEGDGPGKVKLVAPVRISIHALRGEGDHTARYIRGGPEHFYPRPPWGGRPAGPLYEHEK